MGQGGILPLTEEERYAACMRDLEDMPTDQLEFEVAFLTKLYKQQQDNKGTQND